MSHTYHIISNTHWDREWRFPYQRNRQMLVDMIDAVLHILVSEPEYRAFHLDSQSIVLKDYLEIKPQNKDLIIKLTRENRLLHGPWYILPEEFQVGGENLLRNLLLGHKTSRQYGGVSKIGYSPFSWGQISQLPQIYKEFNIDLIMFYRGINALDSPKAEFIWEGADGTRMLSSRFSTMPRYNFYFYIYRPAVHNQDFGDLEHRWQSGATLFHFADRQQHDEDYFIVSPHTAYYPENIEKQVTKIIADQSGDFTTPHVIWMEGHDSSGPNRQTVDIIKDIRKRFPGLDVRHATLEEYAECVKKAADTGSLKLVQGERRSSQNNARCGNLFGYTTSARMYLKQANFDAERWIQYYAEPFNVFSALLGRDINDQYPETAWELIVQNSAHDSIGGCSLDRIHEDMMMRCKHSVEISKGLFERSLKYLLPQLNTSAFHHDDENSIYITAANPCNYERSDVIEAYVDIPVSMDKGNFNILDSNGKALQKDLISVEARQPVLEHMINRPMFIDMVRYHCYVHFEEMPAFGLKTFRVEPVADGTSGHSTPDTACILENEFLRVEAREDGSLNIHDKTNNTEYKGVAWFEDHGEVGHAWVKEETGPCVTTKGSKALIRKSFCGDVYEEITVEHTMMLPKNLETRKAGTKELAACNIRLRAGLGKSQHHLSLDIRVDNAAESHRLRLMVPTRLEASHSYGEGQFDVVARSLERPDTSDWMEQPMYDFPLHHFVDVSDGEKGMAVLVDGLKEYEVLPDKDKTLAITLFRTFEYKINPAAPQDYSHEKGAQMLGQSHYRLALYPHQGAWEQGNVYREAFLFNYLPRLVQSGKLEGSLSTQTQFMKIKPEALVFSALKKPEHNTDNAFIVRIYNPTGNTIEGSIRFLCALKEVQAVTLEEIPVGSIELNDNHSFNIKLDAKKMATYVIKCETGRKLVSNAVRNLLGSQK
ncbi:MAG: glycoside hydrolase family 38 C-terminal domain-containing protein [Bacteroidales bacterium]|nr:glycoside hydrolase family 38 C-terminal domain-containing protein [Bacteroidales bacterium]